MASCSMGYVLSLDSENKADMSELILLIVSLLTLFIFAFKVSMFVFILSNLERSMLIMKLLLLFWFHFGLLLSPRFFKKASGILQSPPSVRHTISS